MATLEIVTRKGGTPYIRAVANRPARNAIAAQAVTATLGGWVQRQCRGGVEYYWSQTATTNQLAVNKSERG